MSAKQDTSNAMMCCASCGKAEGDDIQLRTCTACKSVRYCSVTCQRNHRPKHKRACKKRAAELRDEILFKQPESTHLGDCPICCLPLPLDRNQAGLLASPLMSCCSKRLCDGCLYAYQARERKEGRREHKCPFCRTPMVDEEADENRRKRIEANDPSAFVQLGAKFDSIGDYENSFKYYSKAAELGDAGGHNSLSIMYRNGEFVEKDEERALYHMEEAAIAGHPISRHNLGVHEGNINGRYDRAVKHFFIAANHGEELAVKTLKEYYKNDLVSKEDFAAALRAYQIAVSATKSPEREVAALFRARQKEENNASKRCSEEDYFKELSKRN